MISRKKQLHLLEESINIVSLVRKEPDAKRNGVKLGIERDLKFVYNSD